MVKTHLPQHMDSIRQYARPKHQLLILKCYPRLPKNSAADVKPNGSELSYLLYYASTRRSKLQKVGSFLERKTASDVYRSQSARVLVTLQILTALLENKAVGAGSGFALIAPHVLRIVAEILQSTNDISLIEATLETWDVFCNHQDPATLKADHVYRELYEDVVKRYAALARRDGGKKLGKSMQVVAVQDAIRLREAGLNAIKSMLLSDALASESGRQLDITMPPVLSNIRGEDDIYLSHLMRLRKQSVEDEKEKAAARRMSMATMRTQTGLTDGSTEADPRQAEGTVQDADDFDEEQVSVLALECLRAVFATDNRPQIRTGTVALLRYLSELLRQPVSRTQEKLLPVDFTTNTWAVKLFEICTAWTPVQDRFILIVTAVETLVRLPLSKSDLAQHLLYTSLVDNILRSDLNLIGLSVMDVLLGLVQQMLRVLQLNGPRVTGRGSTTQLFSSNEDLKHPISPSSSDAHSEVPSEARIRLIERLKSCISDLGTHVYYTDQIADMISAILLRLKPNPAKTGTQNPIITAAAIEEPSSAVDEVASNISVSARERPGTAASGFFSFEHAREIALEAVRDILQISKSLRAISGNGVAESRNNVPISIWEGTQWLLRDPSSKVRTAYVDALTVWLQLETRKTDMRVKQPKGKTKKKDSALARRAVSNASNKNKQSKKATSTFLQLLHLAVFEDALHFANMTSATGSGHSEMQKLHYLLTTLVQRLGVNAVQSGLPMIFALQDEISKVDSVVAKVRMGGLVHGYLWVLAEVFDFDVTTVGQEIFAEIKARRDGRLWLEGISYPAKDLEQVRPSSVTESAVAASETGTSSIKPFESRQALVDRIAESYALSVASPAPSAPGSPGSPHRSPTQRRLSVSAPALDRTASSYLSVAQTVSTTLPENVKEAMMEKWTKEGCLAAISAAAPKSVSISGSRTSPSQALAAGNHRQLLAAATQGHSRNTSPGAMAQQQGPAQTRQAGQHALEPRLNSISQSPARRASASTNGRPSSSAGARGRVRVDDLKRVLSGGGFTAGLVGCVSDAREDTASDSLVDVDAEDLGSESGGFVTPPQQRLESHNDTNALAVPASIPEHTAVVNGTDPVKQEPPVLHLSNDALTNGQFSSSSPDSGIVSNGMRRTSAGSGQRPATSRGGASVRSKTGHSRKELNALLASVGGENKGNEERRFVGTGKPPY